MSAEEIDRLAGANANICEEYEGAAIGGRAAGDPW